MDGILATIKTMLGIESDYTHFDNEIIVDINLSLATLTQIGYESSKTLQITGYDETWTDFFPDPTVANMVKTYIHQKVRLLFDPPTNSFLVDKINEMIKELEWRIYTQVNTYYEEDE